MNKKLLTVAIAGAMAAPMSAQAVKYKLSGQVNRAMVFMDDGVQSDIRSVDNIASGTRFRLRGSEDMGNGMKVGFYWELQTSSNPSSGARPDQNSDGNQNTNNIRQANVWFSGNWGKLSLGQLDGAANGASEADLSGVAISGVYSGRTSFTGGINWRTSGGGGVGGLAAGDTSSNFDGFSRYDGVRYDSPALGPVTVSVSMGNDNKWDAAARVNTALGGGQISGALFYGENDQAPTGDGGVDGRYGGSLSYLFSQGTNVTFAYAINENEVAGAPDESNWNIKLGHKWGPHAVAAQYGITDDLGAIGNEDTGYSIGYVYSMKKVNTELYASYMHQELDVNTARSGLPGNVEDIDVFVVGARVKFN
jgi:predicted porin